MADLLLTAGGKTVNICGGTTNALPQRPVAYIRIFGDTAAVSVEQNVDTVTVAGGTPAVSITSASQLRIGRPENTVIISPMGARGLPGGSAGAGGDTAETVVRYAVPVVSSGSNTVFVDDEMPELVTTQDGDIVMALVTEDNI